MRQADCHLSFSLQRKIIPDLCFQDAQKVTKKIKAANKKAENFNMILKSTNSPLDSINFKANAGSNSVDFLTDHVEIF